MGKNLQTWGKALGGPFATIKKGTSSIRLEVNKSKWEGLRNFWQLLFFGHCQKIFGGNFYWHDLILPFENCNGSNYGPKDNFRQSKIFHGNSHCHGLISTFENCIGSLIGPKIIFDSRKFSMSNVENFPWCIFCCRKYSVPDFMESKILRRKFSIKIF